MITLADLTKISNENEATFVGLCWESGEAHGYPWPSIEVTVEFSEDANGVLSHGVMLPSKLMDEEAATVTLGKGIWRPVSAADLELLLTAAQTRFGTPDSIRVE